MYMKSEHADLMDRINTSGDFSNEIKQDMQTAIETFVKTHSW